MQNQKTTRVVKCAEGANKIIRDVLAADTWTEYLSTLGRIMAIMQVKYQLDMDGIYEYFNSQYPISRAKFDVIVEHVDALST